MMRMEAVYGVAQDAAAPDDFMPSGAHDGDFVGGSETGGEGTTCFGDGSGGNATDYAHTHTDVGSSSVRLVQPSDVRCKCCVRWRNQLPEFACSNAAIEGMFDTHDLYGRCDGEGGGMLVDDVVHCLSAAAELAPQFQTHETSVGSRRTRQLESWVADWPHGVVDFRSFVTLCQSIGTTVKLALGVLVTEWQILADGTAGMFLYMEMGALTRSVMKLAQLRQQISICEHPSLTPGVQSGDLIICEEGNVKTKMRHVVKLKSPLSGVLVGLSVAFIDADGAPGRVLTRTEALHAGMPVTR